MRSHDRKAPEKTDPDQAGQPRWRQPLPQPRREVLKNQTALQRVKSPAERPYGRLLPALRLHLAPRHWVFLGLLIIMFVAAGLLLLSGYFTVSAAQAQVLGNEVVTSEVISQASGIDGENIFLVRPKDVADRVAQIPGVAAAEVHLRLPALVIVQVKEYAPFVAWQGITRTLWLSDDGGEVPLVGAPPTLTLIDETGAAAGQAGSLRPRVLANLRELRELAPELTRLYYGRLEGIYYRAQEGYTVYLGDEGSMASKLSLLAASRKEIAAHKPRATMVDLRDDSAVVIR